MPGQRKTTKFTKEIKKPDGFISAVLGITDFIKTNKNVFSLVILFFLVLGGIIVGIIMYKEYRNNSASYMLYTALRDFDHAEHVTDIESLSGVLQKIEDIKKKYPGSFPAAISGIYEAKIRETNKDYLKAAELLEESIKKLNSEPKLQKMLLYSAGINYERAGELGKALSIYDDLINQKYFDEAVFASKAGILKSRGQQKELEEMINMSIATIQDEKVKIRLLNILNYNNQ